MQPWVDKLYGYVIQYGLNFVYAILIFLVGKWLAKVVSKLVEKTFAKSNMNATLGSFVKNLTYFGILIFVAIAALNKLGIETTSFVAILGAGSLAVGLALQGSLANFAAGVMLILFQPFKVGERVEAGGASGLVKEIQIFNTIIEAENKTIIVPNAKITADKIVILRA